MLMYTNKLYLDYLDYSMDQSAAKVLPSLRLRFDLLLLTDYQLCLSVPACIKLDTTATLLMKLTPFWRSGRIQLILDQKHKQNPWNYFANRQRKLENSYKEEALVNHFEYKAYQAEHTKLFYNVFLNEVVHTSKDNLYIRKVFDTDELFRRAVISKADSVIVNACRFMPISYALHMSNILNHLIMHADDRSELFQRSLIEAKLSHYTTLLPHEEKTIHRILDDGFAHANGMSSYAAPISNIRNRFTAITFIPLLKKVDSELFQQIAEMDWNGIFELCQDMNWLRFLELINRLLLHYRKKPHIILSDLPKRINSSLTISDILHDIYSVAMDSIYEEMYKQGIAYPDILSMKKAEEQLRDYLLSKDEYLSTVKELHEILPVIKVIIKNISRRDFSASNKLLAEGIITTY